MVDQNDPRDPERPRGLLSPRDRRYYLGEMDVDPHGQRSRDVRAAVRERLYHTILDFMILEEHIEDRDLMQAVGELAVGPSPTAIEKEEGMTKPRHTALTAGFEAFLRLFYRFLRSGRRGGPPHSPPPEQHFAELLAAAIQQVEVEQLGEGKRLLVLPRVTLDVDPGRFLDVDSILDRVKEEGWTALSRDELLYLLVLDNTLDEKADARGPLTELAGLVRTEWDGLPEQALRQDAERLADDTQRDRDKDQDQTGASDQNGGAGEDKST